MPTYVARISYGKDSLKMLDVIVSRGLPLDRITTSDVWATDTISACLPPVEEFKAKMDEVIWKKYRIEVEHLCARNPDGLQEEFKDLEEYFECFEYVNYHPKFCRLSREELQNFLKLYDEDLKAWGRDDGISDSVAVPDEIDHVWIEWG